MNEQAEIKYKLELKPHELALKGEPGIYARLPYESYDAIPAVRSSVLKQYAVSPKHARYEMLRESKTSDALVKGQALHTRILEPDLYSDEYWVRPEGLNLRTNKDKAILDQLRLEQPLTSVMLTSPQQEEVDGMARALKEHAQTAPRMPEGDGVYKELTIIHEITSSGVTVLMKSRIDFLYVSKIGTVVINDIKSMRHAPDEFKCSKQIGEFRYDLQAAQQILAVEQQTGLNVSMYHWAFIESTQPYDVAWKEIDPDTKAQAINDVKSYATTHGLCLKNEYWPGVAEDSCDLIGLPAYMINEKPLHDPRA